jgi:signal recognition particle subunit SEC65
MGKKSGGVRIKQVGGSKAPSKAALASLLQSPEDFIHSAANETVADGNILSSSLSVPSIPNKKYQMFYPIHETFTMQTDTFQIIYPNYIDPTKTIQQGRRISIHLLITTTMKSHSVDNDDNNHNKDDDDDDDPNEDIENDTKNMESFVLSPTIQEISMALQQLNIRHVLQPYKCYSRDHTSIYTNPGRCLIDINKNIYKNKHDILICIAQTILQLPKRQQRIEQEYTRLLEEKQRLNDLNNNNNQQVQVVLSSSLNKNDETLLLIDNKEHQSNTTNTTTNKKKNNKKKK